MFIIRDFQIGKLREKSKSDLGIDRCLLFGYIVLSLAFAAHNVLLVQQRRRFSASEARVSSGD